MSPYEITTASRYHKLPSNHKKRSSLSTCWYSHYFLVNLDNNKIRKLPKETRVLRA